MWKCMLRSWQNWQTVVKLVMSNDYWDTLVLSPMTIVYTLQNCTQEIPVAGGGGRGRSWPGYIASCRPTHSTGAVHLWESGCYDYLATQDVLCILRVPYWATGYVLLKMWKNSASAAWLHPTIPREDVSYACGVHRGWLRWVTQRLSHK